MIRVVLVAVLVLSGPPTQDPQGSPLMRDPQFLRAVRTCEEGDLPAALRLFEGFCAQDSADGTRWLLAADQLLVRGKLAEGLPFATQALGLLPQSSRSALTFGSYLLLQGRNEEASAFFAEQVRKFPEVANLHFDLGLSLGRRNRFLLAQESYERALEIEPRNVLFHFTAGENCLLLDRREEAREHYRQAAEAEHPHPDALWRLAEITATLGDDVAAEKLFQRACQARKANSAFPRSCFQYSVFLFQRQRFDEASALLSRVLELDPTHRLAWQYQARCLRALGRNDQARDALSQYQQLQKSADTEQERMLLELLSEQLSVVRSPQSEKNGGPDLPDRGREDGGGGADRES